MFASGGTYYDGGTLMGTWGTCSSTRLCGGGWGNMAYVQPGYSCYVAVVFRLVKLNEDAEAARIDSYSPDYGDQIVLTRSSLMTPRQNLDAYSRILARCQSLLSVALHTFTW
jgi:hypothetical protein